MDTNVARLECKSHLHKIMDKALLIGAYYVVCFFDSPITHNVEHRVAYFEDGVEAEKWCKSVEELYRDKWATPYYIDSNVSYIGMKNGGLFNNVEGV